MTLHGTIESLSCLLCLENRFGVSPLYMPLAEDTLKLFSMGGGWGGHVPVSKNATSGWRMNETPCLNKEFHFTIS
jgi:hypothetical protein